MVCLYISEIKLKQKCAMKVLSIMIYNSNISLLSRCKTIKILTIFHYRDIFNDNYKQQCKMKLKTIQRSGVVDSVSNVLGNYNCDSKRLVNLLLLPY